MDAVMTEGMPGKLLLNVDEVAQILGVGRSHLYAYIASGKLRSLKLGRRRKIGVEAVREFIAKLEDQDGSSS